MRAIMALGVAALVTGCATAEQAQQELSSGAYEYPSVQLGAYRLYQDTFASTPFADGDISVIATEGGELRTYLLAPCQNGTRICSGSARGPAGGIERTPDYTIVTGLYGGTFWLSPGGDGALVRQGQTVPLAWNARVGLDGY